jgi:hypothetical protein
MTINNTTKWREGLKYGDEVKASAGNGRWAALVTNYLKANKHRIEGSSDYYRDWEKLRLEAHDKWNLRLSRERNPDRKTKSLREEGR